MIQKEVRKEVKKEAKIVYPIGMKCPACGFPAGAPGKIPVIKYHGPDDDPGQPYQDGTKPCDDPCHGG